MEYCTKSHDSLRISNRKWHWHSRGIGGRTALDYLIKVRGMEFVDAVLLLCGEGVKAALQRPITENRQAQKLFVLPPANHCGTVSCYEEYKKVRQDMVDYQTAHANVDKILGASTSKKEEKREQRTEH